MNNMTIHYDQDQNLVKEESKDPPSQIKSKHPPSVQDKGGREASKRKRSALWNIFTKTISGEKAICSFCKKELSCKSTTTNLHKHLRRIHPEVIVNDNEGTDNQKRSRSRSSSPFPNSTFEVYVEVPDHNYTTLSSIMIPEDVPNSSVTVPVVQAHEKPKEENYEKNQLTHIDNIIEKLSTKDQQQIKQLLYGTNYEILQLPTEIIQQASNLKFEFTSYKFLNAPEQVRQPRTVRLGALQIALPLPTSTPIVEMRKAIHNRVADAIKIAAKADVNIFALQELWTAPFFLCTGEKYPWCEYAEPAESGPTTEFLKEMAKIYNIVIVSPILERDELHNDTVWNTAVVIDNHGNVLGKHRKNHTSRVTGFNESTYYNEGNTGHPVFETEFGKIAINISHGRHHPLNWMMFGMNGAEIVFNPSVEAGTESELLWNLESRCAAMNNSFFTCAINRVGTEEFIREKFGHLYGSSYVTAPDGTRTPGLSRTMDGILITEFDLNMCRRARDFWGFQTNRRLDLYAESLAKAAKLDYKPQVIKK